MPSENVKEKLFILTFDFEEWFHILDVDSLADNQRWDEFEVRIYENTHKILDVLDKNGLKTTFFVLGWAAKKFPDLVRLISDKGHEIGTHSLNHILIYKSSPDVFRKDLRESIDIIENIINKKVRAFRAPGFSIMGETLWAFKILASEGIEIDSSIFPTSRGHGGIKGFAFDHPFRVRANGSEIKEFPINVFKFSKFRIPFSGGGYFRFTPFRAITYFSDRSDYLITYFHPRDFDPDQPVLKELPFVRKLKSYGGLKKSLKKFTEFVEKYDFVDISMAESMIDWEKVPLLNV